jgi:hypothetical protein
VASEGDEFIVTPDPFGGASAVAVEVAARRIPNRRYVSDADLLQAMTNGASVILTGTLSPCTST